MKQRLSKFILSVTMATFLIGATSAVPVFAADTQKHTTKMTGMAMDKDKMTCTMQSPEMKSMMMGMMKDMMMSPEMKPMMMDMMKEMMKSPEMKPMMMDMMKSSDMKDMPMNMTPEMTVQHTMDHMDHQ